LVDRIKFGYVCELLQNNAVTVKDAAAFLGYAEIRILPEPFGELVGNRLRNRRKYVERVD
jgi:hypothetical protein